LVNLSQTGDAYKSIKTNITKSKLTLDTAIREQLAIISGEDAVQETDEKQ